ncbi:MAG: hypothetical protein ABR587_00285, partial [Candidatus Binatia bacterium]
MRRGLAVDPGCIPERESELGSRILNVETLGDCLVEPAGPTTADMVSNAVDDLAASLTITGGKCAAGKMGGLGRACKQLFRCYTNSVYASEPVDPSCLSKAGNKVTSVFDRLESRFGAACATLGDSAARNTDIVTLADDVHTYLRGVGTTTTSTTDFSQPALAITAPEDGGFINADAAGDAITVSGSALAGQD